ncbi:MAG: DUF3037 domain-containing protein [Rhodothermales bacterium]
MKPPPTPPPPDSTWIDYDYAIVRVVPLIHLCSFQNVGVVLHARTADYLDIRLYLNRHHLTRLCPTIDVELIERYLDAYQRICRGTPDAGLIGLLPPSERFHWLTTPRSAMLQTSEVHTGRTRNPEATLEQLFVAHIQGA